MHSCVDTVSDKVYCWSMQLIGFRSYNFHPFPPLISSGSMPVRPWHQGSFAGSVLCFPGQQKTQVQKITRIFVPGTASSARSLLREYCQIFLRNPHSDRTVNLGSWHKSSFQTAREDLVRATKDNDCFFNASVTIHQHVHVSLQSMSDSPYPTETSTLS